MPDYFDWEADKMLSATKKETVQSFPAAARIALSNSGVYDDDELTDYAEVDAPDDDVLDIDDEMSEFGDEPQWVEVSPDTDAPRRVKAPIGWQRTGASVQPSGLHQTYQIEKDDPQHRMGQVLDAIYTGYYLEQFGTRLDVLPFYQWLSSQSYFEIVAIVRSMGWSDLNVRTLVPPLMSGVAYLSRAMRRNYRVAIKQGVPVWRDRPLDTSALSTVFAGRGWGIWVMSPRKRFYTNSHVKGLFHHSSFLRGGKVIAGGEWKATAGRIEVITGKTGHYATDTEALAACVRALLLQGVDLSMTKVGIYRNYGQDSELLSVVDFLSGDRTRMATFGNRPVFAPQAPPTRGPMIGSHRPRT